MSPFSTTDVYMQIEVIRLIQSSELTETACHRNITQCLHIKEIKRMESGLE